MKTEAHRTENALAVQFKPLMPQVDLSSSPAPRQSSMPVKSVAPELEARRQRARLEAQRRRAAEYARQEQQRMREQQVSRQATFKVD